MDAHQATASMTCKVANCPNEAVASRGIYAGLCSHHIDAKRRADLAGRSTRPASQIDGLAAKVQRLGKVGRDVDRLRETAKRKTEEALIAKQRADEAEREFRALARELMGENGVGVEHVR